MSQIVGVSPIYYTLTHRVVRQLEKSGLEKMSKSTNIPLEDLNDFSKDENGRNLNGKYIPILYSHLFSNMTFAQAKNYLDKEGW